MAGINGESNLASAEPTEEDDFDINAEEIPTEDDQTPAVSALEQDDDSADVETDDEDVPDDVRLYELTPAEPAQIHLGIKL